MKISELQEACREEVSPKDKARCISSLLSLRQRKAERLGGTTSYMLLTDTAVHEQFKKACHASVTEWAGKAKFIVTENGADRKDDVSNRDFPKEPIDHDHMHRYIDWLMHRSPWSVLFVDVGMDIALTQGFILHTNAPTIFLQTALVLTRHFYECSAFAFQKWCEIVDKGCPELVAYYLVFCSTISCKGVDMTHDFGVRSGHRGGPGPSLTSASRMLQGTISDGYSSGAYSLYGTKDILDKKYWYRNGFTNYYGGGAIFLSMDEMKASGGIPDGSSLFYDIVQKDPVFKEDLSSFRKATVQKEGYQPPNPFDRTANRRVNPLAISYTEYFEVGIPYFMKLLGVPYNE